MDILGRTRPPLNLVISNVPGPRDPLYCAGAQLQANFPVSVVIDGVGLNITVMSYRDHIDFGIIADRDQVDDVWSLMDGLRRGARRARDRDLRQAGGGRERPPPRPLAVAGLDDADVEAPDVVVGLALERPSAVQHDLVAAA